jgi:hypothetical protein
LLEVANTSSACRQRADESGSSGSSLIGIRDVVTETPIRDRNAALALDIHVACNSRDGISENHPGARIRGDASSRRAKVIEPGGQVGELRFVAGAGCARTGRRRPAVQWRRVRPYVADDEEVGESRHRCR